MAVIKYTGSRTYAGHGVFVSAINPIVEVTDEGATARLLATGRFVIAGDDTSKAENTVSEVCSAPSVQWSIKQLKAYAAENGIDLGGASKQSDIFAKIQEAESAIDFSADV